MNRQFILSVVSVFVVTMMLGFVVHGLLLNESYAALPNMMRPESEAQQYMWAMVLAHVLISVGMTAIYRRGRETGKPWLGQGIRFGLLWAVAALIPFYLIYHAVSFYPLTLAIKQIVLESGSAVVVGITLAALNKA
jgi:hypothetical protein